ncbi:MAG: hypothetical protein H7Y00_09460 [Fimbriimonadaceae bacterium]|nr:hypothetical protein [Chitinophagales bacterium]
MIIEQIILNEWKLLRDHGDVSDIQRETKISRVTIQKALEGEADLDVFEAINKYYSAKKERIEKSNSSLLNNIA